MGRLVYQPVPEEYSNESKHGQLIGDVYSGHLSTNHNNIINSATKRIENKLNDVLQLENNIIEQSNVINNLLEDYQYFLNINMPTILNRTYEALSNAILSNEDVMYVTKGVSDKEDVNGENKSILSLLETACIDSLKEANETNEIHTFMINNYLSQLTVSRDTRSIRNLGKLDSLELLLALNIDDLMHGDSYIIDNTLYVWNSVGGEDKTGAWETVPTEASIQTVITNARESIDAQYTKAQLIRNNLLNRLG